MVYYSSNAHNPAYSTGSSYHSSQVGQKCCQSWRHGQQCGSCPMR